MFEGVESQSWIGQYLRGQIDEALSLAEAGLTLAPMNGRSHLEVGLLHFAKYGLTFLPPIASEDFQNTLDAFSRSLSLEPWRAATHKRVARILLPLKTQCDELQQDFIESVARRAFELDPQARDLRMAIEELGS